MAKILRAVPVLLDMPERRMSVDYDEEADVLYIAFDRPQHLQTVKCATTA